MCKPPNNYEEVNSMYNYLLKRMYQEYQTVDGENTTQFLSDGRIVGTLYRKEQVLNIFLSASKDVVWNHHELALFVVAKKYTVLDNSKARNTEAAWVIGCCGAQWQKTLVNPMYLGSGEFFGDKSVTGITGFHKSHNGVKFTLFDLEVEWRETKQPCSHICYLNPALIYPVNHGGKKVKNAKEYLRKKYNWEYEAGYQTAGSFETRQFIDTQANTTNHTEWSNIRYSKVIRK